MILTIWAIILSLSILAIVIGKYVDAPPLQLAGYLFMFLLGLALMLGEVTYKTGETETYNYVCQMNCLGDLNRSVTFPLYNSSNSTSSLEPPYAVGGIVHVDVYTNYTGETLLGLNLNHIFGFFMSILSVLGFVIALLNLKPGLK